MNLVLVDRNQSDGADQNFERIRFHAIAHTFQYESDFTQILTYPTMLEVHIHTGSYQTPKFFLHSVWHRTLICFDLLWMHCSRYVAVSHHSIE